MLYVNVRPIPKKKIVQTYGDFVHVDEACIVPFDEDDIELKSDLTILLWQSFKSSTDNMMLLAIGHIQLPDTKT